DDLLPRHQFVAVEDVIHAALDGAVLSVAAVAVGLEDRLRLLRQLVGVGRSGADRQPDDQRGCQDGMEETPEGGGLRGGSRWRGTAPFIDGATTGPVWDPGNRPSLRRLSIVPRPRCQ